MFNTRVPGFQTDAGMAKPAVPYAVQGHAVSPRWATIVMASLPPACQQPGASQPWTDTSCFGVVEVCTDKCRVPCFNNVSGCEVSGTPYVCGACFGLPF
jgi:hypothetical protein